MKTLRRVPPVPRRTDTVPVIDLEPEDADPPSDGPPSSLDPDHASSSVRRAEASEAVGDEAPGRLDPSIVAGDPDADVESAHSIGDEVPGGENQTPDQDDVDLIGRSVGVEYDPEEELEGGVEILKRDQHRWELDPASSDDFRSRVKR